MPTNGSVEAFKEIHVVSDLHLGGWKGRQIFNQGPALAAFILAIRERAVTSDVALVLNGDVVDFLADLQARYLDTDDAVQRLGAIADDPAFAPVFDALGTFLTAEFARLVIVLGNHDIELSLPPVQEYLAQRLSRQDAAARGRLRFALDGRGYTATVGGRTVYCVHGNDEDPWNLVDHEALRRTGQAVLQHAAAPTWTPNAGTRLVIDVMNHVKKLYAFVDLLKPETVVVPRVLAALPNRDYDKLLVGFARSAMQLEIDKVRRALGLLSTDEDKRPLTDQEVLSALTRPVAHGGSLQPMVDPLAQAAEDLKNTIDPLSLVPAASGDQTLGMGGLFFDRLRGIDPSENLREALVPIADKDGSFDPNVVDREDSTFASLDARIGADVDVVIAGHTHLERQYPRKKGGVYFNSGTWIRLLRLTPEMLKPEPFAKLFAAIEKGGLEDLDNLELDDQRVVLQRRTVVSVWCDGGTVRAGLRHARPAPAPDDLPNSDPFEPYTNDSYKPFEHSYTPWEAPVLK